MPLPSTLLNLAHLQTFTSFCKSPRQNKRVRSLEVASVQNLAIEFTPARSKTNREETAAGRVAEIFCYHSEDRPAIARNSWKSVEGLFPFALSRPNHSCSLLCMQTESSTFSILIQWLMIFFFFFFCHDLKSKSRGTTEKYIFKYRM